MIFLSCVKIYLSFVKSNIVCNWSKILLKPLVLMFTQELEYYLLHKSKNCPPTTLHTNPLGQPSHPACRPARGPACQASQPDLLSCQTALPSHTTQSRWCGARWEGPGPSSSSIAGCVSDHLIEKSAPPPQEKIFYIPPISYVPHTTILCKSYIEYLEGYVGYQGGYIGYQGEHIFGGVMQNIWGGVQDIGGRFLQAFPAQESGC